ncbi:hypothetical protein MRX96_036574 [Rhipicephalus microplus]
MYSQGAPVAHAERRSTCFECESLLIVRKIGAYIRIEEGSHKDLYGQVEGLDDENARVIVKLALGGKTVTVSELFVSLVSKKDYQKYGKLLNKEKYDDYKKKHEAQEEKGAEKRREERERHTPHKRSRVEKQRESSKSAEKRERSRSPKRKEQFWLRPQIRVRFIDRKYKDGKYYNTKMTIEDVTSRTTCMCNTEDGKILEDIKASMLETVEGLDDENARVIVKLALGGKTVTVSELFVSLVSKKDYQKYGKLLNKEKYDDYKKKHEAQEEKGAEKRREERERHTPHKRSRVEKQRESSKSAEKRERSRSPKRKEQFWLRPQIRVRFIDRKYKDGKYYNTKMTIEDVTSRTTCMCNTEDGKILEDIKASMLETVIPRKAPAHVLVLLGSYCGQLR